KTQKAPLGGIRLDSESNRLYILFLHPRADPLTYTELASVFALLSTSFFHFLIVKKSTLGGLPPKKGFIETSWLGDQGKLGGGDRPRLGFGLHFSEQVHVGRHNHPGT